jgi:hypothetical protein
MASGSQICKPNWADLPSTPQKNNNEIIVNTLIEQPKNDIFLNKAFGTRLNIIA